MSFDSFLRKPPALAVGMFTDVLTDLQNLFVEKDTKEIVRQAYKDTGLLLMSEQTAKELGIDLESEVKI